MGDRRSAEDPNVAMKGLKGETRRMGGEPAAWRGGARGTTAGEATVARCQDVHASPWSDCPGTPHAGARRRRRAVLGPKAAAFLGVNSEGIAVERQGREKASQQPARGGGGGAETTRGTTGRAGGSRRTTGWPAATSANSAKSAQRNAGDGEENGEGEGGSGRGGQGCESSGGGRRRREGRPRAPGRQGRRGSSFQTQVHENPPPQHTS